jgi:hypothetical protein
MAMIACAVEAPRAQTAESAPLAVQCLCKIGGVESTYSGRFAADARSREELKRLIEANTFGLRKTIRIQGDGCGKDDRLSGMDARCGDNSLSRRDASGRTTFAAVPNEPFSGVVTLRITSNAGIPLVPGNPDDQPKVDDKRWNSNMVSAIVVMGVAQKVEPK